MCIRDRHGIVPKTIVKAIADSIEISDKAENAKRNTRRMGKLEREGAQEDFNLPDLVDNLITLTKPVIDEHKHNLDIHICLLYTSLMEGGV